MKNRLVRAKGSRPLLEELEDQVLYSADALGGLDAVLVANKDDTVLEASLLPTSSTAEEAGTQQAVSSTEHQQVTRHEIVFVDTDTPDYQLLVDDLTGQNSEARQFDIFVLDNTRDGIAQISEVLAGYDNLDAVHIISHGTDGSIDLGSSLLDVGSLSTNADDIAGWADVFTESGDFLIYGCNLAESADGQSFVDSLARLTGADVAASDDVTGSADLGGDWNLEYASGAVETSIAISASAQASYDAVLLNPSDIVVTESSRGGLGINDDGGNDAYLIADSGLTSPLTSFTFELQFEANNTPLETVFFSYNTGAGDTLSMQFFSGDRLALDVGAGTVVSDAINYTTALLDGELHTLSVTWDNTDGDWEFFIDGVSVDSGTGLSKDVTVPTGGTLVFGQEQDSVGGGFDPLQHFSGTFHDIRLFDDVRTSTEIATYQDIDVPVATANLVANWTFDDLSTSGVIVDVVSGNNLTVQNVGAGGGFIASTPELNLEVLENAANGTVVGSATGIDPDVGDTLSYTLLNDAGGRFDIDSVTGEITVADGSLLDYEAATSHDITVRVTDLASNTYDEVLTIKLANVNEFIVSTTADSGAGSLREAIANANASANTNANEPDAIVFDIGADGSQQTINLLSALDPINEAVIIDGFSQYGTLTPAGPIIEINGAGTSGADGLILAAGSDGSTIRGLVVNQFDQVGLMLLNSGNHTIVGNYIGTDITGTLDRGNGTKGIHIENSANNQIGGATDADRNVIAANGNDGIIMWGAGSTGNIIQGNYIGVDATGNAGLGNGADGINIAGGANDNTIGGDRTAGEGNVVSGNIGTNGDGIEIDNAGTDNNKIYGNYIGTNYDGTADIANARFGVVLYDRVQGTEIGGTGTGQGNIISGNTSHGVVIDGNGFATTSGNLIRSNFIGLNAAGTGDIANGGAGVFIFGGAGANTIGGTIVGAGNEIAHNTAQGIVLSADAGAGNSILGNSIHSNTGMGIDLEADGVTANEPDVNMDSDTGANNLQNFPVLTSAETTGSQIAIAGSLNSTANSYIRIEFFASSSGDASGHGEGATYLGYADVATDGSGNATINALLSASVASGDVITATATVSDVTYTTFSDTSEFGLNIVAFDAPVTNNVPVSQVVDEDNRLLLSTGNGNAVSIGGTEANPFEVTLTITNGTVTLSNTIGPEFLVNTTTVAQQTEAVIAVAPDDSYVVAWTSKGQDDLDGKTGVYFQRFDATGNAIGSETLVHQTTLEDQHSPAIAMDAAGNFVVSWVSKAQDNVDGSEGVYARLFNADGSAATNEFLVTQTTLDHQSAPTVSMDNAGNFVVVWESKGQDNVDGKEGVYARLFNAAGTATTNEFLVNQTTLAEQSAASVAMDADGDFVVAWQSKDQDGDKKGIYARQFDAAGSAQTNEFLVNQETVGDQEAPSVATDDAGNFVIAWQSKGQDFLDGKAGIVARLYDSTATAQGNEFVVNSTVVGDQTTPAVSMTGSGDFFIAWESKKQDDPDGKVGIFAQYFDATGTVQGDEFVVNQTTPLDQKAPSVALNTMGEAIAVWQSKDQDGDKEGIYGQRFLTPTALTFTTGDGIDDNLLTFNGSFEGVNGALDGLVFTPTANFYGTASIQIDSDDGATTDSDSFNITVNPVNDAPVQSIPGPQVTVESTPLVFSAGNGNAVSIIDDAGANPVQVSLTATHGSISLSGITGLSFTTGDGSDNAQMVFTGTLADINAALEGLAFSPTNGFAGNAYLSISTDDQGNTGAGAAMIDTDTINIAVTPDAANDAPVITVPGSQNTPQDTMLLFSDNSANPIALTDDADGNQVQLTLTATNGTLTLSPQIETETLVNTNTVDDQLNSQVAVAADGSYIVVWESKNQDGGGFGIFAQRYNPVGEPEGAEFQVNSVTLDHQSAPAVSMNADGAFVIVWQSKNQDGDGFGIYGQLFDNSNTPVGGEFEINTTIANDQTTPAVAMDDTGNFVVTWASKGQDNLDLKTGIYAQRFDATGLALGDEFLVNTETLSDQNAPAIAMDTDGDFVIVWQSKDQDGDKVGIYGQRFNASGDAQGGEFQVNTQTLQDQMAPDVAMDDAGNFAVVWQSKDQDGDGIGIYGQRFNASGIAQGGEFLVNSTILDDQLAPSIAMQGSGEFIVAWESKGQDDVDNSFGIYTQRYDASGAVQGIETRVNSTTLNDQTMASVALDADGNAIISWTSRDQDNVDGKDGVYLQRLPGADAITYLTGDGVDDSSIVLTGTVEQINEALDGMVFSPTAAFNGTASVQIDVDDLGNTGTGGPLTDSDTVWITVGTADVAAPFQVNNTGSTVDEAATIILDNTVLRYVDAAQPTSAVTYTVTDSPANGQLELSTNPGVAITSFTQAQVDANQIVYVHDGGETVADSFDFDVDDGSFNVLTGQSFALTINPVNDTPVNNVPGQQNTDTDTALVFDAINGNLISISDDAGNSEIELTLTATNGLITLSGTSGLSFTTGTGSNDLSMTFTGTLADVNVALDGLVFDPDALFTGTATLQIVTDDQGNTGGGDLIDTDVINIEVGNYNEAPVLAVPATQDMVEDAALVFSATNGNAITVADADASGDDIEVRLAVSNGTLTLGGLTGLNFSQGSGSADPMMVFQGTVAEINAALENLTFDPVANYAGSAILQISVNDLGNNGPGGALVDATTININIAPDGTDEAPSLIMPAPASTPEDTPLSFGSSTGNLIQVDDDSAVQIFDDVVATPIEITITATGGSVSLSNRSGNEFAINTHTANHQTDPVVASAANGDYVVVWTSNNQDGNGYGIYGQRFSAEGLPQGGEFRVNADIVSHQIEPVVAMADDGSFVVAWTSNDANGTGVYGQRFSATGATQGGQFQVNTETSKDQSTPAIAMDAAGNFVIVWQSDDQDGDNFGIYGQRYDNTGVAIGVEFQISTEFVKKQTNPDVAMNAAGDFIVVWESENQDGDDFGIYGQRFDASGVAQGGEFLINTRILKDQTAPVVAMDDGGNFVVAWQSLQQDDLDRKFGVFAQRYDAAGTALGAEFLVNTTTAQAQTAPSISMDSAGEFVIVWQSDDQDGDQEGIYGQRYASNGTAIDGEFRINTVVTRAQTAPSVAMSESGSFVAVWSSDNQDGSNTGVFGQRFVTDRDLSFTVGDGIDDVVMTFSATVAEINDVLNGLVFTPDADTAGLGGITVELDDGTHTVSDDVAITVQPINDAPVVGVPGTQNLTEGQSLVFSTSGGNAITVMDADAALASVQVTLTASGGTASLFGTAGLSFVTGDGVDDAVMTFSGTQSDINAALDGMSFNPDVAGYSGPASLLVHVDDLGNTGDGGALTASDTVYITVDPDVFNMAPENTVPGPQHTGENAPLVFSAADGNALRISDDPGENDIELTLTVANGTVTLSDGMGPEILVNSTTSNDQRASQIAVAPNGEYVVVWQSTNQDGDGSGIYGQRYNAYGQAEGPEFLINSTTVSHQTAPVVAMDAGGNFVVAWETENQDSSGLGIAVQRFAADGSPLGTELLVNSTVNSDQTNPSIAMADDGRFVIVWQSSGQDGAGEGVYGQLYASDGSVVGDEFLISTTTTNNQTAPTAAMNAAGDFVVVWQSTNQDGDGDGIYGQRYAADGTLVDGEFLVNDTTAKHQRSPAVALRDDGSFVVVWQSENQDGDGYGIYGQAYDAAGLEVGAEFLVNTTITKHQVTPQISVDDDGDYVVVWQSENQDGSGQGIYGQVFDAVGAMLGDEFRINTMTAGDQTAPAVAAYGSGNFVTTWTSNGQDGSGKGIFAQRHLAPEGLTFLTGDGTDDSLIVVRGTVEELNAALDGLVFTPDLNFEGAASIRMQVDDLGNIGLGGAQTDDDTVDIIVGNGPLIDLDADDSSGAVGSSYETSFLWTGASAPVLVADSDSFFSDPNDGNLQSLTVTLTNRPDGAAETLTADTSGTGLVLTAYNPATGTLTLTGNRSIAEYEQVLRTIAYDNTDADPDESQRVITFVANDGGIDSNVATTYLNVFGPNDAPVFSNLNGNPTFVENGTPVVLDSDVTIFDAELSQADNFAGATLTLARNGGADIQDIFSATGLLSSLAEGANLVVGGTAIGTVTTNSGGTLVLTFDSNATNAAVDLVMQQIAYSNSSEAPPASVQVDWTFDDGNSGAQGVGGALQALGSTTVNITAIDDASVVTGDISYTGNEGDAVGGDMDATDVEGLTDGTYFTVSSAATHGTAVIDPATGVWSFTPTDSDWFGTDSFTVTVTDDLGGTTDQVVSITLANVDDAAIISGDISYTGNEGDAVGGDMDATDVEGLTDGTYFTVSAAATHGTAVIDPATGVWSFTPTDSNWFGSDSFTVTVTDDLGGTTDQVVSITLANVDDAASISGDISYTGNEGDAVGGDMDATDVEGLMDGTYFTVSAAATHGTAVIDPATGVWSFTPTDANWFGSDSFTVTVTDDLGGTTDQVVNITLANVDDAASISGDISYTGNEGDAVGGDMDATDVEGLTDGTYFTVSSAATHGTAVIDPATGVWSFTPTDANWFGSDSFTVTVTDDLGGTTDQVVSITLANVDDAAVITGDISYTGNEGDAVGGDMDATDVDGMTDGTYFTVSAAATHGTAVIDPATGVWSFTPTDANWFGTDSFTVTVTDDLGGTTDQVVSITLANVDDAATISGDISYTGNEGDAVGGDMDATDVEGLTDGTYFTVSAAAANGTAVIDPATGVWSFTPADANWFGTDAFTVTITDDLGGTTDQVVNITLANVDDAAVITGDVSYTGSEGDAVGGDMDATDVEGLTDGTYFTVSSAATHGTAVIDPATGVWSFTPTDSNWFGSDSFTVTVTDDLGGTTDQIVNITLANVDDAAVITGDISYTGNEGDAVGGDMDATDVEGLTDGTYFTVSAAAANGTAVIDPATGVWSFTPTDSDWFGTDAFTVTVTDDLGGTTDQIVNITLANIDDPATISGDISYTGNEGDAVGGDMDATDVEGLTDGTYFTVSSAATHGTAVIDPATGVWSFTPTDANWFGSDSFTVTVTDDLGGTTDQVVSITLANVDDAAVITGDISYTGNEGDAVGGDMDATDVEGLTDGTYFTVSAAATHGTAVIDPATGVWSFTPTDSDWFGTDAFTVTVTDDLGGTTDQIVNITLANIDDPATISGDISYTGNEGDAVGGDMDATDVEGLTDGTYFTVSAAAANGTAVIDPATGVWSFTPADANWFGSDAFTVTITDDLGGTTDQVVNITLANVDDAAVITGDVSYTGSEGDAVGGDMDATDVEGLTDGTYFTVSSAATHGTAVIDPATGVWSFTPTDANWFGSDSFTVTVTDDLGGTTDQVVSITLANVDDAAVITGDISYTGNEGDAVGGDMDATDVEGLTDGTYFTVSAAATHGTAVIDPATGVWSFTPTDSDWFGTDAFTVTVTDDLGGTTDQIVNITLANIDDPATISGDISYTGNEGDAVGGDMDATDVEGLTDGTYFTVSAAAANGTAVIDPATGVWSFTPADANWFGSDAFTVTITDDLGGTTDQVVNITLANVDDAAVITGDVSYTGSEGDAVGGDMDATDVEGLTDGTYFTVSSAATHGTAVIDPATGVWSFTPTDSNWFGSDSFTVTVTDDLGGTTDQIVNITLANVDDAAVITGDISYTGNEGDAVGGDMDATDVDGMTDGTYFTVSAAATHGTAVIDPATGVWSFTPTDANWFGTDSFTVTVTDDLGGTTDQVVSITLANVDDAATISGDISYTGNEGDAVGGDMDATDVEGLTDGTYFTVSAAAANGTAVIDPATGVWSFTPADANWFGTDSFTVTITDDLGGTTDQIVNITLANVDDAAVVTGDVSYTGNEGDAVGGDMDATDVDGMTDGTYFTVSSAATNGTAVIDPDTGVWSFTPTDPNWFGTDAFTVTVTDDLGGTVDQVVSITLTNVDDTAVITGDVSYTGNEGDVVAGDMDAADVDGLTDGTYFTVSAAATNGTAVIDPATGVWSFTPTDPNWFGTDAFTVTITDDLGGTTDQVVNITLANVDDAATISGDISYTGNEGDAVGGDMDATDVDGMTDGTYFTISSAATNGIAVIDPDTGVWSFTPTDSNWFGTDAFMVTVTDDLGGTVDQVVSITLTNVDDAAVITGDVSYTGNEGDVVTGDMDATDVEGLTDGTYFTVNAAATNGTAVIDPATGVWSFTPTDSNWFGTDTFTVTITDDLGGTTDQVVSITLANVDDAAVITGDVSYSGNEGDVIGGDVDATDVEGMADGTYFTVSSAATNGAAVIDPATGVWSFTPTDANWFGTDSFTVTITDDLGGTTDQVVSITLANVDDAAVITGDVSYTGNEGDAVGGDMDANDVDGMTDGTYFTVSSAATNGTAVIDPDTGVWSFTPTDPNWFGTDAFTVTVTDDLGGTTDQVVNITLANVDDAAVITGDVSYTGNEGDVVTGDMDATDVDGLTDGTYFTVSAAATNGTAVIDPATGVWSFTPTDSNWFGTDSFTVTITDDLGGTTDQVVNITLTNVDDAAVISGDISYTGNEGDAVGGDMDATDVEGLTDGTVFTVSAAAANGTAVIDPATGMWSFTPTDSNWFGTDSFTVTITDDLGGTTDQVVSITLANVDDAAVISGDISYTGNEGDAVGGDVDATDVEGLTDGTVFTVTDAATNGTAVIDPATGIWSFTPTDASWFGTDSFTVTVTDDLGGTTDQVVNITLANVDDAAVITGDVSFSGNEGDVIGGDIDATDVEGLTDGTYFTVSVAATNGTAVIDPATGVWSFTPTDSNWFGTDTFTVTITDDLGGTTDQVVSITLANVDDAAVITGDVSYSGNEGDVIGGDIDATDVEGMADGTYFTVSSAATNGAAVIDPATGVWSFTPTDANWFGTDSFTVTITDDLGGTTDQVVSITLANVDDAAVITGDVSYTGNEGDAVGGDMDANDVDGLTDGTVFTVTAAATNGTAVIDSATGVWSFTPTDSNWFGTDSFTVTITDDLGATTDQVVSITLANIDDAAVVTGDVSYAGNEGDVVGGDIDASDVEGLTDGTYFTVSAAATNGTAVIDPATGAWSFTPTDSNWFGTDSFTVTITDDLGATTDQVVSITLANIDDAAVVTGDVSDAGNEGDVVGGDIDATDVDGLTDGTVFTVSSAPTNGTAAVDPATGIWTFTPTDANWFGSDSFTVTVTDDQGGTIDQVVNITLANVDDTAIITGDVSFSGNEGDAVDGDMDASDVDGLTDGTVFSISSAATNGTAVIDPDNGTWTFTPADPDWFGSDSFTVTITDDLGGSTDQIVSVTLASVDDAAVITGDISYIGNEGDSVGGDLDATDVEGLTDGTVFSVTSAATNGNAVIDPATGAWSFTSTDPNWFGSDTFTITVTDDLGSTTSQVISITLANVDDPAIIGGVDTGAVTEDVGVINGNLRVSGALTITDPDVGESSFEVATISGSYGVLTNDATGNWDYVIDNSSVTVQALDAGETLVDTLTVTTAGGATHDVLITITGAEDAPVISGNPFGAIAGNSVDTVQGQLSIDDVDTSDGTLSFNDVSPTSGDNGYGQFQMSAGAWTYSVDNANATVLSLKEGETIQDSFEFTASDGSAKVVTVTIHGAAGNTGFAGVSNTAAPVIDDSEDYEWLSEVVALTHTDNGNGDSSVANDIVTPLPTETGQVGITDIVDLTEIRSAPVLADDSGQPVDPAVSPDTLQERHDSDQKHDAIDDAEILRALLIEAGSEINALEADGEVILVGQDSHRDSLHIATQMMREEMRNAEEDERFVERITDISLRVSGTIVSTGSLAWLLRGASLFASLLSSIPTWKGFDPLPVLNKSRRSRKKLRKQLNTSQREEEDKEAAVGRVLDTGRDAGKNKSHENRNEEGL